MGTVVGLIIVFVFLVTLSMALLYLYKESAKDSEEIMDMIRSQESSQYSMDDSLSWYTEAMEAANEVRVGRESVKANQLGGEVGKSN